MRKKLMKCKEIRGLLTAYLDGEVTPREKTAIEAHLAACPRCRAELEALSAMQTNLRRALKSMAEEVVPSTQVWDKVRARLQTGEGRRGFWSNFALGRVVTAAVTVAILIIAFLAWQFIDNFKMGSPVSYTGATSPAASTNTVPPTTVVPATTQPTAIPAPILPGMITFDKLPDVVSAYGEGTEIELGFTNEGSAPRLMTPFPPEIKIIKLPDLQPPDDIARTFTMGDNDIELQPGESARYLLEWDQKDDDGQQVQPGWYGVAVTVASKETADATGGYMRGLAARILVLPPQGTMEKTIKVNESVTVTGLPFTWSREEQFIEITITLEQVEMTADSVMFTVLMTSPAYKLPQGPDLAPPQWMLASYARYTIDGITKNAGVAGMRPLENGLQLRWGYAPENIDPIPSDAKEITFTITQLGDWEGPWEFTIQLN